MTHACNPLCDELNGHVVDVVRRHAVHTPDRLALAFQDSNDKLVTVDYATLDRRARAIAARLQHFGGEGRPALLLFQPGLDFVCAFLACLYAGVVAVPSYVPRRRRSLARLESITREADISYVLTTESQLAELHRSVRDINVLAGVCWLGTDAVAESYANQWRVPDCQADTLACLQYTSGSTTDPKGVMLTHGNLLANSRVIRRAFEHSPDSRGVIWLPPYHDMGLIGGILQPLLVGFPTILMSPFDTVQRPIRWLEAISKHRATTSGGPNFAFDLCVDRITEDELVALDLSSWRVAFNGAEPIRRATLERFAEKFGRCGFSRDAFLPCYGLAEATLFVSGSRAIKSRTFASEDAGVPATHDEGAGDTRTVTGERSYVSSGAVAPELQVVIVDPQTRRPVCDGEFGEIWIAGDSNAAGYWNRPEHSEGTFRATLADERGGAFLRSGDMGAMCDGELYVTGRLKDLVIIDGRNHHAEDIEQTVQHSHDWLHAHRGAVFTTGDECSRLTVVQEIPRARLGESGESVFKAICTSVALEHELAVAAIHLVKPGAVPKTPSGKIQRRLCREKFLGGKLKVVASWNRQDIADVGSDDSPSTVPASDGCDQIASANRSREGRDSGEVREWLRNRIAERLQCDAAQIDIQQPLANYGLTSRDAVEMSAELESRFERKLSPTLFYDHPSIDRLVTFLASGESVDGPVRARQIPTRSRSEPIAIVGMGCRFPGASSPAEFWRLLVDGVDAISDVPTKRSDASKLFVPAANSNGASSNGNGLVKMIRRGGWLTDVDRFDPAFFGISPREAKLIDPQQKLLLEVAWETLEDLGLPPSALRGSRTGVFVGSATNDYRQEIYGRTDELDPYWCTGNATSIVANRLSYVLDLCGPSMAVDTACSSSLVAIHLACRSLRMGECDLTLTGGVNLILSPDVSISFAQAGGLASDGRCKAFDARADGIVRSEGIGLVALKRLCDAEADGDSIYAVIRGSAMNQDGRSNGITAPSQAAQTTVIREAWRDATLHPADADYFETHGAGTLLGDVIEAHALGEVLGHDRKRETPCMIGSVKTNIGHCEAAAGIAGLIKVALAMRYGQLPGNLHFRDPNPSIRFDEMPIRVQHHLGAWPSQQGRRTAGVSSFGFGGANAHIVLESVELRSTRSLAEPASVLPTYILPLSAARASDLAAVADTTRKYVVREPNSDLTNLCLAAATRREHFRHRAAIVFQAREGLLEQLEEFETDDPPPGTFRGSSSDVEGLPVSFVFSGHGGQWPGMQRELIEHVAAFRAKMHQCDAAVHAYAGWSLFDALRDIDANSATSNIEVVHTCLFAFQTSLAATIQYFGVDPAVVTGHSMGEVAAAHVAGALSLEDAVRVIVERSRVLQRALETTDDCGGMAALKISAVEADKLVRDSGGSLTISVTNSPEYTVLAGPLPSLQEVVAKLRQRKIAGRIMEVPGAAHTPALAPLAETLLSRLAGLHPRPTNVPFYSTQLARCCDGKELDAEYWAASIHRPVQFAAVIGTLFNERLRDFIEIGPHPRLTAAIAQCARAIDADVSTLPTHAKEDRDLRTLAIALAKLHCRGASIQWNRLYHGDAASVHLPTYPWQREQYWIDKRTTKTKGDATAAAGPTPDGLEQQRSPAGRRSESSLSPSDEYHDAGQPAATTSHTSVSSVAGGMPRSGPGKFAPDQLRELPQNDREQALRSYLCEEIARTLELDPAVIGMNEPLTHLGIDSLMALEVKNRVENELAVTISIARFLEGPTVSGLTEMLLPQLERDDPVAADSAVLQDDFDIQSIVAGLPGMTEEEAAVWLEKLDEMSDDEVNDWMQQLMDKEGGGE